MTDSAVALVPHLRTIERSLFTMATAVGELIRLYEDSERSAKGTAPLALADLPRTEAIEAVLQAAGEALSPVGIWARLKAAGRNDPKMEVQVTTYDLWRRGRIDKVGRGRYVAKEHRPDELPALRWVEP